MPKTMTNHSLHYCVTCDDCGTTSNYDGRIGNTELCQHVNTTANYECNCNLWTRIIIHGLFEKWDWDRRYRRKHKYNFEIVNCDTGEVFKKTNRYEIQKGPYDLVDIIADNDNFDFVQTWTLNGSSLSVHYKSPTRDDIHVIRSGRN